jgi:hypothetical protein
MSAHHLKLNFDKTEWLFLPVKACPLKDLSITVDNSTVSPSQSTKNLDVTLDNTLLFSANIKAVTHSCRFMLYNICRVVGRLQLAVDWAPRLCHQTAATYPERSSPPGFQPFQVL